MNEYTMKLIEDLRDAERELFTIKAQVASLMRLVAYEEFRTAEYNRKNDFRTEARITCDSINAIFGWANAAEREEGEDGETE